jgi:hypothetical protein
MSSPPLWARATGEKKEARREARVIVAVMPVQRVADTLCEDRRILKTSLPFQARGPFVFVCATVCEKPHELPRITAGVVTGGGH